MMGGEGEGEICGKVNFTNLHSTMKLLDTVEYSKHSNYLTQRDDWRSLKSIIIHGERSEKGGK